MADAALEPDFITHLQYDRKAKKLIYSVSATTLDEELTADLDEMTTDEIDGRETS